MVRDGDFIGLVAPDAFTAQHALSTIQAKWDVPRKHRIKGYLRISRTIRRVGRMRARNTFLVQWRRSWKART